jgi:hypothetical protein
MPPGPLNGYTNTLEYRVSAANLPRWVLTSPLDLILGPFYDEPLPWSLSETGVPHLDLEMPLEI